MWILGLKGLTPTPLGFITALFFGLVPFKQVKEITAN